MIPFPNAFVIRTIYFAFCLIVEVELFKRGNLRRSWLGRLLRLGGLIVTVGLLMLQNPTITTLDDFFGVLLGPAVVCLGLSVAFGYLKDWCNDQIKVIELEQQFQPLITQRSDFNDG